MDATTQVITILDLVSFGYCVILAFLLSLRRNNFWRLKWPNVIEGNPTLILMARIIIICVILNVLLHILYIQFHERGSQNSRLAAIRFASVMLVFAVVETAFLGLGMEKVVPKAILEFLENPLVALMRIFKKNRSKITPKK
jgi:hypothetical protein